LLSLICVCGLSAGVCFADETSTPPSEWYYFEKSSARPDLPLRDTASEEGKILLYIPHSYAFEKLADPDGAFIKVKYNSKEGYISTAFFNSNCKKVTAKWGNNPYAYDLSDLTMTVDDVITYDVESMEADPYPTRKSDFAIKSVYGYRTKGIDYYFLVDAVITYRGNTETYTLYVKASDTNRANFSEENIPINAGYTLQTTPDKPSTPSGEITSGDENTPPSADKNGSDTQSPKNSLDRYILIAVIAVLCVVIVILIFVPTKRRQ
ncbi:MAG: hypothetical protein K2I23_05255, partial [Clostridia bacterium]|nr:hypothetical protein [Clostridia bacterium]